MLSKKLNPWDTCAFVLKTAFLVTGTFLCNVCRTTSTLQCTPSLILMFQYIWWGEGRFLEVDCSLSILSQITKLIPEKSLIKTKTLFQQPHITLLPLPYTRFSSQALTKLFLGTFRSLLLTLFECFGQLSSAIWMLLGSSPVDLHLKCSLHCKAMLHYWQL